MKPNDEIRGYKIESLIGKGALGEVWRARGPGDVAVAIKVMFRRASPASIESERLAVERLQQLRHPYLLSFFGSWATDDHFYLVLELAESSLLERLAEHRRKGLQGIPTMELLPWMREAAEALDFLHTSHVFPCDVRPSNLLLLKGHIKVADYAHPEVPADPGQGSQPVSGAIGYLAPEVFHNKVVPASDQYSLAATYVELRRGKPLVDSRSVIDAMMAHLQLPPDLQGLSPAEQPILAKALAKDPAQRFASCVQFIRALEDAIMQGTVLDTMATGTRAGHGAMGEVFRSAPAPSLPDSAGSYPEINVGGDSTVELDVDQLPPLKTPAPKSAGSSAKTARAAKVERQATVRYYNRMNPQRTFPLLVALSQAELKAMAAPRVSQARGDTFQVAEGSVVEVEPVLPGCLCYPPKEELRVEQGIVRARFWVVPQVLGKVMEPHVVIRQEGKLLAEVQLTMRVVRQSLTVLLGLLTFILPFVSKTLAKERLDLQSQVADGFQGYIRLINVLFEVMSPSWLMAVGILLTCLAYLWLRPRRKEVFWSLAPVESKG